MKTRCEEVLWLLKEIFGCANPRPLTGYPPEQAGNNSVVPRPH